MASMRLLSTSGDSRLTVPIVPLNGAGRILPSSGDKGRIAGAGGGGERAASNSRTSCQPGCASISACSLIYPRATAPFRAGSRRPQPEHKSANARAAALLLVELANNRLGNVRSGIRGHFAVENDRQALLFGNLGNRRANIFQQFLRVIFDKLIELIAAFFFFG